MQVGMGRACTVGCVREVQDWKEWRTEVTKIEQRWQDDAGDRGKCKSASLKTPYVSTTKSSLGQTSWVSSSVCYWHFSNTYIHLIQIWMMHYKSCLISLQSTLVDREKTKQRQNTHTHTTVTRGKLLHWNKAIVMPHPKALPSQLPLPTMVFSCTEVLRGKRPGQAEPKIHLHSVGYSFISCFIPHILPFLSEQKPASLTGWPTISRSDCDGTRSAFNHFKSLHPTSGFDCDMATS